MAHTKRFEEKLDDLWRRRTANIRSLVRKRRGPPQQFSKESREEGIGELQDIATDILLSRGAWEEFGKLVVSTRRNRISRGESKDTNRLLSWASRVASGPTVYSFWKKKRCLYVGKAEKLKSRLSQYMGAKSAYITTGMTIKVHVIKRIGQLGKAECLAIHLFKPSDNRKKAAHRKWGRACPICSTHDLIKGELQSLFKMK